MTRLLDVEAVIKGYRARGIGRRWPYHAQVWDRLWADVAAQYRRGELSDADYDRLLSMMP